MSNRRAISFAGCGLLLAFIAITACGSDDRQTGCTAPSNEAQLLEAFRDDPVFNADPPAARRIDGPRSSTACRVLNREDTSSTSVTLTFELTRAYTRDDLTAAYDRDVRRRGWAPVAVSIADPTSMDEAHLSYCKLVRDVPAYLSVDSVPGSAPSLRSSLSASATPAQTAGLKDARLVVSLVAMPAKPCPPAAASQGP